VCKNSKQEKFIEECKFKLIDENGNPLYDYTDTVYTLATNKINITCLRCNTKLSVTARDHKNKGTGCGKCNQYRRVSTRTFDDIVTEGNRLHNNAYDYIDSGKYGYYDDLTFFCKVHNISHTTLVGYHLRKDKPSGCPDCALDRRRLVTKKLDSYVQETKELFNNIYDYSLIDFNSISSRSNPITYFCTIHNVYISTTFESHFIYKTKCHKCSRSYDYDTTKQKILDKLKEFDVDTSEMKIHYNPSNTVKSTLISNLICTEHNLPISPVRYESLIKGYKIRCELCKCSSKPEKELAEWIYNRLPDNTEVITSYRPSWLNGKEIDIYIPSLNLGIEFNGTVFHHSTSNCFNEYLSTTLVASDYHLNKYLTCLDNNVKLIHIFEFENICKWKRKLSNILRDYNQYDIVFSNELRTFGSLKFYGKSKIIKVRNNNNGS